ncbi:DUF1059 domain-containing protein [Nocardia sp. NPDC059239]|uniref:DUF1059 domain-containing protein n=1 Tax=Nocardia sp. NPDC059239 TaxID=3346785 RepID=UPI003691EAA2
METRLGCPCGETIVGEDSDDLVRRALDHLGRRHPGRSYDREEILLMARWQRENADYL